MAKNDYSRRSEKDMFWSNDTQQDIKPDESAAPKAADAIVPPNNPSQPQQQSQKTPKEYIDIEKFISRNKDRFSRIILLKITVQIIAVVSAVAGAGATWPYSLINFIIVFFLFLGGVLSFSGLYDRMIKDAIKNITKIKNFSTSSNNKISWNSLIKVLKDSNDVRDIRCSELKISTDNATMTSFALKIYRTHYTNKIDDTMLYGECFYAEMDYKSLTADGLTLLYGKMPFFRNRQYRREVSQYSLLADKEDIIDNCNTAQIIDIADKIHQQVNGAAFIMHFTNNSIIMIVKTQNMIKNQFGTIDYNIPKCLRRDLSMILNRVAISDILIGE